MIGILFGFYFARSVSSTGGVESIFSNPAGFSRYYRGFLLSYNLSDSTYIAGFSMGFFGLFSSGKSTTYTMSLGRGMFSAGVSFNDVEKRFRYGFLFTPFRHLSLGYYDRVLSATLRPLGSEMLELSLDAGYDSTYYVKSVSAGLNFRNFMLSASYSPRDDRIGVGISLAYDRYMASGKSDGNLMVVFGTKKFPSRIGRSAYVKVRPERVMEDKPEVMFSSPGPNFYEVMRDMDRALRDPFIKGIYLDLSEYSFDLAQTEELRNLLRRARERGKKVVFYSNFYDFKRYYLASVGNRIILEKPFGAVSLAGLYMESFYFKELLDSLGIVIHAEHFEEYKSAVEPFTRTGASKYDRQQRERILRVIYGRIRKEISAERNIGNLDSLFPSAVALTVEEALSMGLVDTALYRDEVEDYLREYFGTSRSLDVPGMKETFSYEWKGRGRPIVAVVFAEGTIVDEDVYNPFSGDITIGENLAKLLRKLRKDRRVKAVVLRVSSPGGSAITSDIIAREMKKLAREKLVIVSMGRVAASGGYYISAYADTIMADAFTITGSIGILALIPKTEKFLKKTLKINSERFIPYPHADVFSTRPLDSVELGALRKILKDGYFRFLEVVSQGRGIPVDSVRRIAKGRVWIGEDAYSIGLVDTLGGLLDAVELALEKVGRGAEVVVYTRKFRGDYNPFSLGVLQDLLDSRLLYWNSWDWPQEKSISDRLHP